MQVKTKEKSEGSHHTTTAATTLGDLSRRPNGSRAQRGKYADERRVTPW